MCDNSIVSWRPCHAVKYNRLHQGYEEFLPVIPPEMELVAQDLMTYAVNLTCVITERSLFVEIFFVFTISNKGNPLSFSSIATFSWKIYLYIFTFFLFVCSLWGTEETSKQCMNQAFPSQCDILVFKELSWMCTWDCTAKLEFFRSSRRSRAHEFWGVPFDTNYLGYQMIQWLFMSLAFSLLEPSEDNYFKLKNLNKCITWKYWLTSIVLSFPAAICYTVSKVSNLLVILTWSPGNSVFLYSSEGLQCKTNRSFPKHSEKKPGKEVPSDCSSHSWIWW